jgi:hypothetical protein
LELLSVGHSNAVDVIEVGRAGVSRPVRFALAVADSAAMVERLSAGGGTRLAEPVETPWRHRSVRLEAPDGMQLTLFTVLDE